MGCEAPKDEIEEIICQVIDEQNPELGEIRQETSNNLIEERDRIEAWEKIGKTVRLIWAVERDFLHSYFQIPYEAVEAVEKIKKIQANYLSLTWKDVDGVVWAWTLKLLYIRVYSQDLDRMPTFQKTRWEAYEEMQAYMNNPRIINGQELYVNSIPNVFDDRLYWWGTRENRDIFRPREWTMFAEWVLADGFDISQTSSPNSIQIFTLNGRNVLALYDNRGRAILATYTSPWDDSNAVRWRQTLETHWNFQMHHLSRDHNNAPMAYGINVQDRAFGIMIHAGVWKITWYDESSWCFRIGIWYAKFIYDHITQNTQSYTINVNI